jgi:hypothetical protein
MKSLATILSIFLTSVSFSQSENLVDYQIEANSLVTDIKITAHSSQVIGDESLGRIADIFESTINLKLNPNRNYTVVINNNTVMEINKEDLAENNASQISTANVTEVLKESDAEQNSSSLVYYVQIGAFKDKNVLAYFSEISNLKTEKIAGTSIVRYMIGDYENILVATSSLESLKSKGYKDAFVVAYLGDKRISTSTAIALE